MFIDKPKDMATPPLSAEETIPTKRPPVADPIQQIENDVVDAGVGNFEVTIWDTSKNLATAKSKPPYEVIVNGSIEQFEDNCFIAKNAMMEIMKAIYTDQTLANKISRVLFSAPTQLRASIGARDGYAAPDMYSYGPSLFWSTLRGIRSHELEAGSIVSRTWGRKINPECD